MSVKGKLRGASKVPSIDQRWKNQMGGAEDIKSARIDPAGGGWLFDRGIEPWRNFEGATILDTDTTPYLDKKFDSIYVWTKQNTGQVYHLFEQDGELYFLWGNNDGAIPANYWQDRITIAKGRKIPKLGDVGTQYIPFGNRLLIINGDGKPIWFYGDDKFRDFGFTIPTPQLETLPIQQDYSGSVDLKTGIFNPGFTNSVVGLGDRGASDVSAFTYRMTFISDTGSESPLGGRTYVSWENASGATKRHGIFINDMPTGPNGIVARRIYRTKNQRLSYSADSRDEILYLVRQINDNSTTEFIDIIPDNALVQQGPDLQDSSVISSTYQFGESWNNRLWLGGGPDHPTKIIYSNPGLPEQFGEFSYFDVGSTSGGHITQIYSFYNNLLVFRESSIDIIRAVNGTFTVSQVTPDIGTVASNTVSLVPGVGVVFLGKDGIYSVNGGLDGGSTVSVVKISDQVSREIEKISIPALPSAFAVYSKKEKEWWCHYVRKGETLPSRGIVLHQETKGFSFRGANDKTVEYLWYFTCCAVDPSGNFIFGTSPDWRLSNGAASNPTTENAIGTLVGPQVWSGARSWGRELIAGATTGDPARRAYTDAEGALLENKWESNWFNFGDSSLKKRVFSVEMEMISYGDNLVELEWGYDYDTTWYSAGSQKITKSETVYTADEDPVFGPTDTSTTKSTFTIGTSALKGGRIVVIRWDVNTKLVENFRFRIKQSTGKPFHMLGMSINYDSRDQQPLNQLTRLGKGQPI